MAEAGVSIVTFDLKKKKYPLDTVQRGTGSLVTMSCSAANKVRISGPGSESGPFGTSWMDPFAMATLCTNHV